MPRKSRHTLPPSAAEMMPQLTPKALTKQEFGRRLNAMMVAKGWNQSDLARAAKMGRFSISNYINGKTFPTPRSLEQLAKALGVTREELLPNSIMSAMDEDVPAFEIKQATGHPGQAWVRLNRLLPARVAGQIHQLIIEADMQDVAEG